MKSCSKCKQEKKLEDFGPAKNMNDGHQSWCLECINELKKMKKYTPKIITCKDCNKDKPHNAQGLCQSCYNKRKRATGWKPNYPKPSPSQTRIRAYGQVINTQFELACKVQNNRCSICGEEAKLVIDHDHKTGEFRGAICGLCNKGLGLFKDNIASLLRAADYLARI